MDEAADQGQVGNALSAAGGAGDSKKRRPAWGRGTEGQRKADLGEGSILVRDFNYRVLEA
jgi:hypothetical protein